MARMNLRQEGLKDCGPVCLANIIKHYNGYVELDDLKVLCNTTKKGTTAYDLIEASKKCGFEAMGMRLTLKEMQDNIIFPCIAHVTKYDSYYHFLIIEKIDFQKQKVFVLDPGTGKETYSFEDFDKIYTGVLIQMYPITPIPYETPYSLWHFIKNIMAVAKKQFIQIIVISSMVTFLSIVTSFYIKNMVDNIALPKKVLLILFICFLLLELWKVTSDFLRNKILILMNEKIDFYLTTSSFKQIVLLPFDYYRNHTTGEIVSRIHDLEMVRQVISKVAVSVIIDIPLTIIVLAIMYVISPTLTLISFILLLLYLAVVLLYHTRINKAIETCQSEKAYATSYMVESIEGFESLKGCNLESSCLERFDHKYFKFLENLFKFDTIFNRQYFWKELICSISSLTLIFIGINLVKNNEITLGSFLAFQSLFVYFASPLRNLIDFDANIKQAKNAINKVMNMFHKNNDIAIMDKPLKGDIVCKHLCYEKGMKKILDNVNLTIKEGNKVMLTGKSGSGKSSLCRILKKYYEVNRKQMTIANIDINDYKWADIVYVAQKEVLFTDTIDNIIDSDQIMEISKICMIDEMVDRFPLGYKTLIEEDGFNISGGEKQRIVLARALAQSFSILIIDEGLSQVDINMERRILKNIFNKYNDKTIIFVSHRLDNQDLFDQIITLEEGKVVFNESKNRHSSET